MKCVFALINADRNLPIEFEIYHNLQGLRLLANIHGATQKLWKCLVIWQLGLHFSVGQVAVKTLETDQAT